MERRSFLTGLAGLIPATLNMNSLHSLAGSLPNSVRMPVLFLGHGSPMNAIEENEFVAGFRKVASTLPRPKAILCVSAHWYTRGTMVTAMDMPPTIHDFGGFPQALFDVQYPAKGNPDLAMEAKELLQPTAVGLDDKWGLDHGAWSVLVHLFPKADVPVVQLSIDHTKPASYHYELAGRLAALRDKGVLIIGSGNIVHNLRMVDFANMHRDNYGYDWAVEARTLTNDLILNGDHRALTEFEKLGKAMQLAVPTPDHYLPLIYALGLKTKRDNIALFNDKLLAGSLSMTSVKIG